MVVECADISVTYRLGRHAGASPLRGVSVLFDSPSMALMGPSGSGKSTLLRVIAGLQRPDAGWVSIEGEGVRFGRGLDPRVAFVQQDYRLVDFLRVGENVALGGQARGLAVPTARVDELLEAVGLGGFESRWPDECSGGEQQRVAVARALAAQPRVLLADEPTGALDEEASRALCATLLAVAKRGTQVVVATHDRDVASRMGACWRLRAGELAREQ